MLFILNGYKMKFLLKYIDSGNKSIKVICIFRFIVHNNNVFEREKIKDFAARLNR